MFIYEITDYDRDQIMRMLQWAEWALAEHVRRGVDVDFSDEKRDLSELWDHIATMEPSRLDEDIMASRVAEIKQEMDALFRKGE